MEVITKINNNSVDIKLQDSDYNDVFMRFNQDGNTTISFDGNQFKNVKSSDFNKLSEYGVVGEIAKTIQHEEDQNVLKTQFNNDVDEIKNFFNNSSEPESSYQNDTPKNNSKQKLQNGS